ncbi:MAG: YdcF family protein [Thiobacillaceae bacterium]|jgi:uncharacterized SAM-binding protein YcdF (DUF218 family)|nr:YdcF family protein [Thiobacillaceae bacterium]MBP9915377.1 YdcF family protein [Thiobacillaceae bacterium]
MSNSWLLTNLLAAFLLPPLNLLLIGATGYWLLGRKRNLGKALIAIALGGLWLLSTPMISAALLDSLKPDPVAPTGREADAIVILGGGSNRDSLEFGGDTLNRFSIERVRYGAWLAKRLGKPVLVTGGAPDGGSKSEAEIMATTLGDEYGVATEWMEPHSRNTRENARNTADILGKAGIQRIYLVTHSWHLRRAIPEFETAGLKVVPAGTGYFLESAPTLLDFLPNGKALDQSYLAMHEWIGLLWYRIRD